MIICGRVRKQPSPLNTYLGLPLSHKSFFSLSYIVVFGATTKKFLILCWVYRYAINAPISLVFPTPVARAKVKEIKSLSKSEQVGYIACTAPRAAFKFISFRRVTLFTISSRILSECVCGFRSDMTPLI